MGNPSDFGKGQQLELEYTKGHQSCSGAMVLLLLLLLLLQLLTITNY